MQVGEAFYVLDGFFVVGDCLGCFVLGEEDYADVVPCLGVVGFVFYCEGVMGECFFEVASGVVGEGEVVVGEDVGGVYLYCF